MYVNPMIVAMLGASMANAHMLMTSPVPYGKDTLTNAPLAADGSDFPCKLRSNTYQVTEENTMAIGESHKLTFEGSATHGGGSCQISLTTDLQPSKSTSWKVIKSFEGGCPANVEGNLSGGSTMADPYTFNFTIPDGITAGKYTLAWTWFNRIGNREMYMNCAPLTVTGGSSKRSTEAEVAQIEDAEKDIEKRSSSFPPMFVANINGCITKESVDIRFPQPGEYVEYDGEPSNLAPKGEAACTGTATFAGSGDTSSGSSSSGSSGSDTGSSSSAAASNPPAATSSEAAAPEPTSSQAAAETTAPTVPEPASPSTSQAAPAASASSSSSSGTLSGSCSPEGTWNCISGTSFQRCASGQWTVSQQLASGTQCSPGQSSELSVSASKKARAVSEMRFRKRTIGESYHA
ncbi:uncharacterized protein N7459_008166 [Penicillium hispanicum]|uniref:uncharacterized protein n=1 Tax=Penicillium hispanicum TaxID=1080232 RepID=UPI00253FF204|nr:uncharacterized protein N7459_008166 [Penicillium hispanicum]KAJ5573739.1 hypothetical protein N7459_008166 [Penicillium hispanicum]